MSDELRPSTPTPFALGILPYPELVSSRLDPAPKLEDWAFKLPVKEAFAVSLVNVKSVLLVVMSVPADMLPKSSENIGAAAWLMAAVTRKIAIVEAMCMLCFFMVLVFFLLFVLMLNTVIVGGRNWLTRLTQVGFM